jgi:hypothetical protein
VRRACALVVAASVFVLEIGIADFAEAAQPHVIATEKACLTGTPIVVCVGDATYYVKEACSSINGGDIVFMDRSVIDMMMPRHLSPLDLPGQLYGDLKSQMRQAKYCSGSVQNRDQYYAPGHVCRGRAHIYGFKFDFDGLPGLHQSDSEPTSSENCPMVGDICLVSDRSLLVDQPSLAVENPRLKRQDDQGSYSKVVWAVFGLGATFGVFGLLECWAALMRRRPAKHTLDSPPKIHTE